MKRLRTDALFLLGVLFVAFFGFAAFGYKDPLKPLFDRIKPISKEQYLPDDSGDVVTIYRFDINPVDLARIVQADVLPELEGRTKDEWHSGMEGDTWSIYTGTVPPYQDFRGIVRSIGRSLTISRGQVSARGAVSQQGSTLFVCKPVPEDSGLMKLAHNLHRLIWRDP